jgi:MoxR-like ATPase
MGIQHKNFADLLQTVQAKSNDGYSLNIWLVGPAGTGKTTAAKRCAEALGLDFYFTGSIDTEYKLLGFVDAQGKVVNTAFKKAYTDGGVFLFDECDSSLPSALLAFNAALANGECAFPEGVLARHKDFVCIAAANTWGLGATNEYVGRLKMDAAFLDRFVQVDWQIDEDLERVTVGNDAWVAKVQKWRKAAKDSGIKVMISPRASYAGAALLATGMVEEKVIAKTVRKSMNDADWAKVNGGRYGY